jgi:succinyldiaminopimelate transaminase
VIPSIAYPTYAIGAHVAGAQVFVSDDPAQWPEATRLVWLNSPSNPTGEVLGRAALIKAIERARELGAVLASDECYAELPWDVADSPSLLDHEVTKGSREGLLALYSMSKQSNLAGYRAAVMAGDSQLIAQLLLARKHLGLIMSAPVQAALSAVLADDEHVAHQREKYRARRDLVKNALLGAGFTLDHSEAGLYLWVTRGEDCFDTVSWFSERGILVTPGSFYGEAGSRHVRVALTATDEQCKAAAERLSA